jgi:hypothetical protein
VSRNFVCDFVVGNGKIRGIDGRSDNCEQLRDECIERYGFLQGKDSVGKRLLRVVFPDTDFVLNFRNC